MIAALLCLVGALLVWPSVGRGRPRRLVPAPGRRPDAARLLTGRAGLLLPALGVAAGGLVLSTPVVAGLAAGCAAVAGRAVQQRARAAAVERGTRALVEALGVLVAELRAGRPLGDATATAVDGCPDPRVARGLGPVLRLGEAPPGADPTLVRIAAAVRLSARTGCSLAGVAAAVEDDLRARLRAEEELRSAVAGPRASATVLAGLPVLGLLMGSGVGADPWRVLTTTGPGTVLLVLGVALELAGITWTGRLVRRAVTA
ncbi:pilus assembly protein TadB [Modestobacter sp. VKM Ac-2986]|uniref:type II secretion system F family protein n=1 Tax=Modestobacter sp. VKM Ac-2986 TaxID=3004140 RepID=UPI0022AB99E5|nr:pilus assembly protein TadB [Modestobacter sp. VKM Ac-2986]MCZ2830028.1 pilus assembly protein TadB [Modestobacter sp. VKM Ac-2986]